MTLFSIQINLAQRTHEIKLILYPVRLQVHAIPQVQTFNVGAVVVDVVKGSCCNVLVS